MAGAIDLFSGSNSVSGANKFRVDKSPLNTLYEGVDDVIGKQAQSVGGHILVYVEQYVQKIAQELINAIIGLPLELLTAIEPALLGAFQNINTFFTNVTQFLGGLDPLSPNFVVTVAAEKFINEVLLEAGILAQQSGLDAVESQIAGIIEQGTALLQTAVNWFIGTLGGLNGIQELIAWINGIITLFGELDPFGKTFNPAAAATTFFNLVTSSATLFPDLLAAIIEFAKIAGARLFHDAMGGLGIPTTPEAFVAFIENLPAEFVKDGERALSSLVANINNDGTLIAAALRGELASAVTVGNKALNSLVQNLATDGTLVASALSGLGTNAQALIANDLLAASALAGELQNAALTWEGTAINTVLGGIATAQSDITAVRTAINSNVIANINAQIGVINGYFNAVKDFANSTPFGGYYSGGYNPIGGIPTI